MPALLDCFCCCVFDGFTFKLDFVGFGVSGIGIAVFHSVFVLFWLPRAGVCVWLCCLLASDLVTVDTVDFGLIDFLFYCLGSRRGLVWGFTCALFWFIRLVLLYVWGLDARFVLFCLDGTA